MPDEIAAPCPAETPAPAEPEDFDPGRWLEAYRAADGKALAYVYAADKDDPDAHAVLDLRHAPNTDAADLARQLSDAERTATADHIWETEGYMPAMGAAP